MFLGNKVAKGRGYASGFQTKDIPKPLEAEELESLVKQLGSNDQEIKNKIIMCHLGLALQIIGRYVAFYASKTEDLVGVAMVSLSESVNKFDSIKKDNNITGYIVTCLHGHLATYIQDDKTVKISWRAIQKQVAEYKETGVRNDIRTFSLEYKSESTYEDGYVREFDRMHELVKKALTTNDFYESDIELKEVIDKIGFNRYEHIVFTGLMSGDDEATIAKRVGKTRQSVNLTKLAIRAKLEPYYSHLLERGYLELDWSI